VKPSTLDRLLDTAVVPGFSKIGYALRKRSFSPLPRMDGKTVVVSGATSGIGLAAARRFAELGAGLVLLARNPAKTAAAEAELAELGAGSVRSVIGDLSLMADVRAVADELLSSEPRIDVLVNNAGVLFTSRGETQEGIERTLAVNLLGHFLLTNLLIPRLCETGTAEEPARIVNVSSGGMYTQRIRVRDLQWTRNTAWNGSAAYARTKRGQVILTEKWAEMLDPLVVVNSMHPGWADTPGVDESLPTFRKIVGPILRDPAAGADTIVWLAADPVAATVTGEFWHDRRVRPTHRSDKTVEAAQDRKILWDELARLSGWTGANWPDRPCR
jgi:NAD(P)-dependent dehydrogenase (short-subunit alcohol dehydrogenase family)